MVNELLLRNQYLMYFDLGTSRVYTENKGKNQLCTESTQSYFLSAHYQPTWKSFDNIFFSLHFTLKAVSSSVAQTQTKFFSLPFWQTLFCYEMRRRSVSSTVSISYIFPKDNLSTSGLKLRTLRILRYEQQQQNSYSCILSVPVTPSFGSMLFGWLAPSNRAFHFKLETT